MRRRDSLSCISLGQSFLQLRIVAINVVVELHFARRSYARRAIHDQNGNRPGEIYSPVVAIVHGRDDVLPVPWRLSAQHPHRQRNRILHADASVAEVTLRSREQLWRLCAMKIDAVVIGKDKLYQS